ncbi:MAG: helix-turn-helix domain-containing protein [Bacteroidales bacterium]|nr:helix-turn-helix domain-containing protein [Bacteroidales bacterium]
MMQHEHPHGGETLRQAVISQPGTDAPANYLTLAEAAAFLGLKKSYLYKLTSTRQIPFFKYGGRLVLFDRAALETWRAARLQAVPTLADAQAHAAAYCAANPLKR